MTKIYSTLGMACVVAIAFMLQGYDQAVFNGLVSLSTFVNQFPQIDTLHTTGATKHHNSRIQGTVVAIYEVGCAFGALSCWFLGDRLGRIKTTQLMGIIVIIGTAIQASSFSMGQLIFARVFTGLGVGGYTATIPMWISECATPRLRGRLVLICGGFAITGIALASWVDFGFYWVKHSQVSWRFPIAFQAFFAILVTALTPLLPESPRWLAKKGRMAEAGEILLKLRDGNEEATRGEMAEIEEALLQEREAHDTSPFTMNSHKQLQRTLMAISINILAQMAGINVVTFFSTSIFQEQLHYNAWQSRIFSASIQIWQAGWAWSALWFVSKFGRRTLLMSSAFVLMIALACLTGLVSQADKNLNAAKASIAFDFVVVAAFPVGLFLIPMMYAAEISNQIVRHKVTAMASCANWLFNFLIAEITPIGFADIGFHYYIIYIFINLLTIVVVYLFFPETKGRSLEDIDGIFYLSKNPFDTVRVAANYQVPSSTIDYDTKDHPSVELLESVDSMEKKPTVVV